MVLVFEYWFGLLEIKGSNGEQAKNKKKPSGEPEDQLFLRIYIYNSLSLTKNCAPDAHHGAALAYGNVVIVRHSHGYFSERCLI